MAKRMTEAPVYEIPAKVKLCKNCKWYWRGRHGAYGKLVQDWCTHERVRNYDLVTGKIGFVMASALRHPNARECGTEGKLWEKK
jgi:hypothetical protein